MKAVYTGGSNQYTSIPFTPVKARGDYMSHHAVYWRMPYLGTFSFNTNHATRSHLVSPRNPQKTRCGHWIPLHSPDMLTWVTHHDCEKCERSLQVSKRTGQPMYI